MKWKKSFIIILGALLFVSCGGGEEKDIAALTIEAYLQALVDKDSDTIVSLSCAAWEEDALTEIAAYDGVTARLEGAQCQLAEQDGEDALVSCQGSIIATYSGEDRPIALDGLQFEVKQEAGEWRMCGYR